jgi:hypothetical protein
MIARPITNIADIIRLAIDQIKRTGLQKQSIETDRFYLRLLQSAVDEIDKLRGMDTLGPTDSILRSLEICLSDFSKKADIGDSVRNTDGDLLGIGTRNNFEISVINQKALSQKMFARARSLETGDVGGWNKLCREAEGIYRATRDEVLPPAYKQTKSNIKRMLQRKMDLSKYESESAARKALLRLSREDKT